MVSLRILRLVTVEVLLAVLAGAAVVLLVLLARAWEAFWPCSTPVSCWRLSVALLAVALTPAGA